MGMNVRGIDIPLQVYRIETDRIVDIEDIRLILKALNIQLLASNVVGIEHLVTPVAPTVIREA